MHCCYILALKLKKLVLSTELRCVVCALGPVKVENTEQGDDYLEPVSPERGSLPADETYSDAEQEDDEGPADEEEDEDVQSEGSEADEDDEEDEVGDEVTDEDAEGEKLP